MAATMRAECFYADTKTVTVEDVPIPEPGPVEVLVKVEYCGIGHFDLGLINSTIPAQVPVITQGHGASGTVVELGQGVSGWSEGDRVILAGGRACTTCDNCRRADTANCQRLRLMAIHYDGGWAEYTLALSTGLIRVPDNVSFDQAAILADAVSTPFAAVVRTGNVKPGESVFVWGVDATGTHIVQLSRLAGAAPIIAVDVNPTVLERAIEVGADYAFCALDADLKYKLAEATGGKRIDVAFDAVGLQMAVDQTLNRVDFEQTAHRVDLGGRMVSIGVSAKSPTIGPTSLFILSHGQVFGHLGQHFVDIETLASLVSRGRLDLSRSISAVVPLEEIGAGISMLETGEGNPICVLVRP